MSSSLPSFRPHSFICLVVIVPSRWLLWSAKSGLPLVVALATSQGRPTQYWMWLPGRVEGPLLRSSFNTHRTSIFVFLLAGSSVWTFVLQCRAHPLHRRRRPFHSRSGDDDNNKTINYGRELERIYVLFVNTLLLSRIPSLRVSVLSSLLTSSVSIVVLLATLTQPAKPRSMTNNTNPIVGFSRWGRLFSGRRCPPSHYTTYHVTASSIAPVLGLGLAS